MARRAPAGWASVIAIVAVHLASAHVATAAEDAVQGKTRLSGPTSGWALVTLTEPVRVFPSEDGSPDERAKLSTSAPGRMRGALLRSESPNLPRGRHAELLTFTFGSGSVLTGTTDVLPAGRYRMQLYVDRGPATALLDLPNRPGELALTTVADTVIDDGVLMPRPGTHPHDLVYGRGGTLASSGAIYTDVSMDRAGGAIARTEQCWYLSSNPDGQPDAYDVGCPGGESLDGPPGSIWFDSQPRHFSGVFHLQAGGFGIGGNVQYPDAPPTLDAYLAILPFDFPSAGAPTVATGPPPAGPPTPTPPLASGVPTIVSSRLAVRRGRAAVRLRCPPGPRCRGQLRLLPGGRWKAISVPAGHRSSVRVALGRALVRRLAHRRAASARVELSTIDQGGVRRLVQSRVQLRRS